MQCPHAVNADTVQLDDVADQLLYQDDVDVEPVLGVAGGMSQDVQNAPDVNCKGIR